MDQHPPARRLGIVHKADCVGEKLLDVCPGCVVECTLNVPTKTWLGTGDGGMAPPMGRVSLDLILEWHPAHCCGIHHVSDLQMINYLGTTSRRPIAQKQKVVQDLFRG